MEYLSIHQTADKWGISIRRVQILCSSGRIPGAKKIGSFWVIPEEAEKPRDARIKSGKYLGVRAKARKKEEREASTVKEVDGLDKETGKNG